MRTQHKCTLHPPGVLGVVKACGGEHVYDLGLGDRLTRPAIEVHHHVLQYKHLGQPVDIPQTGMLEQPVQAGLHTRHVQALCTRTHRQNNRGSVSTMQSNTLQKDLFKFISI